MAQGARFKLWRDRKLRNCIQFIHCILQLQIFFWFLFVISIYLLKISFCSGIAFLISMNCLSVFPCSLLSFPKRASLNYLLGVLPVSISLCQLLEDYCHPSVVSCFPDFFFIFLDFLQCCLHMWCISNFLQSLLSLGVKYLPSSLLMIVKLSHIYWYTSSTLLAPPCGRILKLLCLLLVFQHTRPGAVSLPLHPTRWH